jgi:hypothetical protein
MVIVAGRLVTLCRATEMPGGAWIVELRTVFWARFAAVEAGVEGVGLVGGVVCEASIEAESVEV